MPVKTKVKPIWWVTLAPLFTLIPSVWKAPSSFILVICSLSVSFSLSCFSRSPVLSLSVCGAALTLSSRPVCPIEPVKKRAVLLHGPPGVVSDGEAVPVVLCIQWKEQGQRGADCIFWASFFIRTSLFLPPPFPLIFMILGMHSEAAGTLGGWWGALVIPPSCFILHSVFLPKSYFFPPFTPRDRSTGWVSSESSSGCAVFIHAQALFSLYVWKDHAGWNLPPPTSLWFLKRLSRSATALWKDWFFWGRGGERERDVAALKSSAIGV